MSITRNFCWIAVGGAVALCLLCSCTGEERSPGKPPKADEPSVGTTIASTGPGKSPSRKQIVIDMSDVDMESWTKEDLLQEMQRRIAREIVQGEFGGGSPLTGQERVRDVIRRLRSGDAELRTSALRSLGEAPYTVVNPVLAGYPDVDLDTKEALELVRLGSGPKVRMPLTLARALAAHESAAVRKQAAALLARLRPVEEAMLTLALSYGGESNAVVRDHLLAAGRYVMRERWTDRETDREPPEAEARAIRAAACRSVVDEALRGGEGGGRQVPGLASERFNRERAALLSFLADLEL